MENHHFSWENSLFLWPFSTATKISSRVSTSPRPCFPAPALLPSGQRAARDLRFVHQRTQMAHGSRHHPWPTSDATVQGVPGRHETGTTGTVFNVGATKKNRRSVFCLRPSIFCSFNVPNVPIHFKYSSKNPTEHP